MRKLFFAFIAKQAWNWFRRRRATTAARPATAARSTTAKRPPTR
jgi:hypothetical protein